MAKYEGGYANVKGDNGGETYAGISRKFHPTWDGWAMVDCNKPLSHNEIIHDSKLEFAVRRFYKVNFWDKIKGDSIISQRIAELLYDYSVHSGKRATTSIQSILGLKQDGIIGNVTLSAINNSDEDCLFSQLKNERLTFLVNLSEKQSQRKFRDGWISRVNSFV